MEEKKDGERKMWEGKGEGAGRVNGGGARKTICEGKVGGIAQF